MPEQRLLFKLIAVIAAFVSVTVPILAQGSPAIRIETIQAVAGVPLEFGFRDDGTAAASYTVEFAEDPGVGDWTPAAGAVITPLGGDVYRVVIPNLSGSLGEYRVVGLGPAGETVIVEFATARLRVTEGDSAQIVIAFSAPFYGTVRYSLSGTATAGDYAPLSGEISVFNSMEAVILVTLAENETIDPLRNLVLTLEVGSGAQPGMRSQVEILVNDADARWEGSFLSGSATIPFTLDLIRAGGATQGFLIGGSFRFFPPESTATAITLTPTLFAATAPDMAMPTEATLLNLPALLQLELVAVDGEPDEEVGEDFIRGRATLTTTYPDNAHLNTAAEGLFLMQRTPPHPSGREIDFVGGQ